MANFGTFFNGDKKPPLSWREACQALRFMMAAECEAIQMYEEIADAIDIDGDENATKVEKIIRSIIREEKVHVGEFLAALYFLDPKEESIYKEGMKEVDDV